MQHQSGRTSKKRNAAQVLQGGGADKLEKQRQAGKLTARERIDALVDPDSFQEIGTVRRAPQHAVRHGRQELAGRRRGHRRGLDRRPVGASRQPGLHRGRRFGGRSPLRQGRRDDEQSLKTGSPFIFINDSGGARVQEGIDSLSGYGKVFYTNVMLSGAVPQISLICGPCAGGAAYSPALTDFIIQTRQAQMFITGPQVIKQVTGESVTAEQLGGPAAQMANSGVMHFIAENDGHAVLHLPESC